MPWGTGTRSDRAAVDNSFRYLSDINAIVTYLRSVPAIASADLPASPAPVAPASHRDGVMADARGKVVFGEGAASCHGWSSKRGVVAGDADRLCGGERSERGERRQS